MKPKFQTHGSSKLNILRQVSVYFKPYKLRIFLAFIALTIAAAATLVLPVAVRQIIDQGFFVEHAQSIDRYFLVLLGIVIVIAVFAALRFYLVMWLGERIVADIRTAVYQHVIYMDPAFFEITHTGEVQSRLTTDTTLVMSVVGSGISVTLRMLFMLTGSLFMLAVTSPQLAGLILVLVPVVILPLLIFGRKVRKLSKQSQDRIAESSAIAGETLNAIHMVQSYILEVFYGDRFAESVELAFDAGKKRLRARALLTGFALLIVFAAILTVIWIGTQFVLDGKMTVGELSQFLIYALFVATSTAALSEVWGDIQRAAGAMERLLELLATIPVIRSPKRPVEIGNCSMEKIQFDHVTFHYPSRPSQPSLSNFSLVISPGETIALVGPSGAGKSTVFHMLLRFYDPQQGQIGLGGIDISTTDIHQLRSQFGLVPQETIIFAADVMENIRFGNLNASEDDILNAAKAAAADEFIGRLPQGYNSYLGERGTRLSGGQKQRIAIARAILKNPPVLLLDEATSSLDAESEKLVQHSLELLMKDRTTIVIAHRLATVLKADRIVVMDRGEIVAIGKHHELLKKEGLYSRLAELQFGGIDEYRTGGFMS